MSKSFGRNQVSLDHIDLDLKPGTSYGTYGENGAVNQQMMKWPIRDISKR